MVATTRSVQLVRRAGQVHFAVAFFPTLAVLTYPLSPKLPVTVATYGIIAFCVSVTVYTVLLLWALAQKQAKKQLAPTMLWLVAAQGVFMVQSLMIVALMRLL